jgi:SAM-dependent methyltransferase
MCGHTIAYHRETPHDLPDYHDQYDADFAAALERTRRRQARKIADALEEVGAGDRILDFGCGRGWFLDECYARGRTAAGLDASALAVSLLQARSIEAHPLSLPEDGHWSIPEERISFRPKTVTLFDVIEHFPVSELRQMFAAIIGAFGDDVQHVVVKVPISTGFLYRLSLAAARIGTVGPLEQMYQVGTFPPHFHYFSSGSIQRFLATAGFEVLRTIGDPDFDAEGFKYRVGALRKVPFAVGNFLGHTLRGYMAATRQFDSLIVIATRQR